MSHNHEFTPSSKSQNSEHAKVDESHPSYCNNEADSEGRSQVPSSTSTYFYLDRVGEERPKADKDVESSKNDDEGVNGATGGEDVKLPERIVRLNQTINSRPTIEGLDLDEYIRKQNIVAPPKQKKRKSVQHERPLASRKLKRKGKIDPRISSDEEAINSRQPHASTSGLHQLNTETRTREVRKDSETVRMIAPKNGPSLEQPTVGIRPHFLKYEDIPEWTHNSWEFLTVLENKGIPLFWEVLQRVDYQGVAPNDQSRQFRCVVSFNHIVGVCEASKSVQAKHGAAWNFLQQFKKATPSIGLGRLGPFPDMYDDAILLKQSAFHTLLVRMKEIFSLNVFYNLSTVEQKINGRTLFKSELQVAWAKFEGSSYVNGSVAELFAIKAAYEKLLGEPCPTDQIHLGPDNCTAGGGSIYRIVESQRIHRAEFSNVNMN